MVLARLFILYYNLFDESMMMMNSLLISVCTSVRKTNIVITLPLTGPVILFFFEWQTFLNSGHRQHKHTTYNNIFNIQKNHSRGYFIHPYHFLTLPPPRRTRPTANNVNGELSFFWDYLIFVVWWCCVVFFVVLNCS